MDPHTHDEQRANLERIIAHQREVGERLDQMQAQHAARRAAEPAAPHPLDPEQFETSIAQVRRWSRRDVHPTWMHAAYADLAQRMEILYAEVAAMRAQLDDIKRLLRHDDNDHRVT